MSSTVTSSAAAVTTACTNLYETPVRDANCAMPYGSNHTAIMEACCGDADVVSYYNNCGLYCLALGQSVKDLTSCLYDHGAAYQDVFCNGTGKATATGTNAATLPASAQASIIGSGTAATATASGKSKSSGTSTGTSTGSTSTSSGNAAPGTRPKASVTALGLTIGALLFSATAFGALQI